MPESPRIFISYASRDGRELAVQLYDDLSARNFDVWLDRKRLKAGDRWTIEIETALNRAGIVLVLLSEGSYASDTCRAEQECALDAGKRVIPLRVHDCKTPLRLHPLQHLDFSANYPESFSQLLECLGRPTAPSTAGPRYNNSPPLPANFVDRPDILTRLRDALFADAHHRRIALTSLQGMGGIGKTVLAQALCQNPVVQHSFPDGIFWFTIGRESGLRFDQRIEAVPGLKQLLGEYQGETACISQFRHTLRDKAALIVLDDVWRVADIQAFQTESLRSRLLITTRDSGIAPTFGAREFTAELPADSEAREVLARWAGQNSETLPPQANQVLAECGNLPLALAMIGAQLRDKAAPWWDIVLGHLRRADLTKIMARFPEPHTTLFRAIEVSVDALRAADPPAARRYLALAVLLEDMPVAIAIQQTLWSVEEGEALETADRLIGLSLAQRDGETSIRLHDLQLDYLRAQWPDPKALALIHGAVRLSAHVIEKHPREFASQVLGRLLPHRDTPAIRQFLDAVCAGAPRPWLRPVHPALHPPGTPLLRTLEGHSLSVQGVAVSEDGRRAISASEDYTLRVWDLETGRTLRILAGHTASVESVAMTPDGRHAVSASRDRTLKVWELETGRPLHTLEGHTASVECVVVMAGGKRAVSASRDKTLKVWDLETGRALRTLEGHADYVSAVAVASDGTRAVSASVDKTLKVWDLEAGQALRTLEGHSAYVYGVTVTPDGKRAVSASADHRLKVWDLETGSVLRTLIGHGAPVCGVAVTPDGKRAVSASWDHTLIVWELETGRALCTLEGHSASVEGVAVAADGKRAVSASADTTLKVWDVGAGQDSDSLQGHFAEVTGLAVTADGTRAVSASGDQTLRVWDLETGATLRILGGHSATVSGVAVTADGTLAVSSSRDQTLKVWSLEDGRALLTMKGHAQSVSGVAVTADGNRAVSASRDKTLRVWDLETGRAVGVLHGHSAEVSGVALTADGKRAVSASWDHTLNLWEIEEMSSGRALRTLEGHAGEVFGVALTADGKRAISASVDRTLKVWDLDTGQTLRTLEGHSAGVYSVSVTADDRRAVSASWDKTLKVWDLDSGLPIAEFHCDAPTRCCAFAGHRVVAGDEGGRLYILWLEE